MMFAIEIPSIQAEIGGNVLSLTIGGVKAYNQDKQNINMLMKNGEIIDLTKASDNLNISALAKPVEKYFLCYPFRN
jgi:hypothetical protein